MGWGAGPADVSPACLGKRGRTWLTFCGHFYVLGPALSMMRVLLVWLHSFAHYFIPSVFTEHYQRAGTGKMVVNKADTTPAFVTLSSRRADNKTWQHIKM